MSEAKFTKGEWKVRGSDIGVVDESDTQSYGMILCVARVDEYDFPDDFKANARLIAKAPKMYDLLGRLTSHDNCKKDIIHLLGEADSLLAEILGEQQ